MSWPAHLMLLPSLLALFWFLACPPGSIFVSATGAAKSNPLPAGTVLNTSPVPASQCQFPFMFDNTLYYGCTTAGDSKPWCVVKDSAERGPQDWRFCDAGTIAAALAGIVPNEKCSAGWAHGAQTVYGCIKAADDKEFACKPDPAVAAVPCTVDRTKVAAAAMMASSSSPTTTTGSKVPIGAIAGGVGGLVAVALLIGIILQRRASARKKSTWSENGHKGYGSAGNGDGLDLSGNHSSPADFRFAASETGLGGGVPPPPVPVERYFPVISTYTPTLGDELEIQPGDKVQLVIEYDDGWCQGINLSRGGAKGVFPKHCIDMTGA